MMKRIFFGVVMIVLTLNGMAYGRTYKIAVTPWVGWSSASVAETRGFWKEQGIDVRVVVCADNIASQSLFRKKRVDMIFDMIGSAVGMYMRGIPVTIIAETNWSHGGDKIICRKGADMAKLKGVNVGVYLNQAPVTYFLNQYLSTVGLKLSDVRIVEMETKALADHFIRERFKCIVCYDPDAIRAEQDGSGNVVATSTTYEGCIPEGIIATESVLKDIPREDLIRIFKGWIRAVRWSREKTNWKEYTEILNNFTFKGVAPYSEKKLKKMLDAVSIHDVKMLTERNQDSGGLITYLSDLKVFLKENKMLRKDFNPNEIFDNMVIMEVLEEMKGKK